MILPDAGSDAVVERAEALRAAVKQLRVTTRGQQVPPISVSIGVSAFPENGTSADELMRAADAALYQAKGQGRDRVVLFRHQLVSVSR